MIDLSKHPCFSNEAHGKYGRMHIPCAPKCNLNCAFCGRGTDHGEAQLPGRTMRIVRPYEVKQYVSERLVRHPEITVLGIAGPGEPLFNEETFETLAILQREFPQYPLCLGSNGYFLPENVERLKALGVQTLTVTVNTLKPEVSVQINPWVVGEDGEVIYGKASGERFIAKQLRGIAMASAAGIIVKVNTVYLPTINADEMRDIALEVKARGASIMNIMPLKPAGRLSREKAPSPCEIHKLQWKLEKIIPQFQRCQQCRADACGLPGQDEEYSGCILK